MLPRERNLDIGIFLAGTLVMCLGLPVGIVMGFTPDKARVDVAGTAPATMPAARTLALRGNF